MSRRTAFQLTLLAGVTLAVLGFALAAPIGVNDSPVGSNPRMAFAPLVFVIGIMLLFVSAVVYELFPER